MLIAALLTVLLLLFAADAGAHFTGQGHMHKLAEASQIFDNHDCRDSNTCELKRFALKTAAYEVWFSDDPEHPTYGKGAIIEYETRSVDALEKFAVVQFKKGCVYHSGAGREVRASVRDLVPSFGAEVPFCFPDWVIDSQDSDPVYNSDPEYGRFYLLRWNRPGSYEQRTQQFYGAKKPKRPVVYLADYPAGAFVTGTGVRNVALAFKTCIYRAADVPLETRRTAIDFAQPIHCFEWRNVYVYDFAARAFHSNWPDFPQQRPAPVKPRELPVALFMILFIGLVSAVALLVNSLLRRQLRAH